MQLSEHAEARWEQRFPTLNFKAEVLNARRLTSRYARVFRQRHEERAADYNPERRDYWFTLSGAVLVAEGDIVVTVLKVSQEAFDYLNRHECKREHLEMKLHYKSKACGIIKRHKLERPQRKKHSNRHLLNEYAL